MILSMNIALSLILFIFLIHARTTIHILEFFACWMWVSILGEDFNNMFITNLGLIKMRETLSGFWSNLVFFVLLTPLLSLWFMNFYVKIKTIGGRWILVGLTSLLLAGLEFMRSMFGDLFYIHWKIWWSLLHWLLVLILNILLMNYFRFLLRRRQNFL